MMQVQFDDIIYTGFTAIECTIDVESLSADFKIYASTLQGGVFPVKRMQKTIIYVDNTPILTGYIDTIEIDYSCTKDSIQHNITVTGRNKLQDLVDSSIDSKIQLNTPATLITIIQTVLNFIGLTDVKIINNAGDIDPFGTDELISGYLAQNAFDFLDEYCAKRQVLMTSDGLGNIVLTTGQGVQTDGVALMQLNGTTNNIKEAHVKYDDSKRFYKYTVRSQANNAAPDASASLSLSDDDPEATVSDQNKNIVSVKGEAFDTGVRTSRIMSFNADISSNVSDSVDRAQWEKSIRQARAINYNCIVNGHRQQITEGLIWTPLQIIRVEDDFCGLDDSYIIRKVKYTWSLMSQESGGAITNIDVVPVDTYTLMSAQERRRLRKRKRKKGLAQATQSEINQVLFGVD